MKCKHCDYEFEFNRMYQRPRCPKCRKAFNIGGMS